MSGSWDVPVPFFSPTGKLFPVKSTQHIINLILFQLFFYLLLRTTAWIIPGDYLHKVVLNNRFVFVKEGYSAFKMMALSRIVIYNIPYTKVNEISYDHRPFLKIWLAFAVSNWPKNIYIYLEFFLFSSYISTFFYI